MDKAGKSEYYELVTEQNAYYRRAVEASFAKNKSFADGVMFQRGIPMETLGNVDNGVSIFNGLNYKKLPHFINWNLNNNSKKPIALKAV
jgi:hypothetical protein